MDLHIICLGDFIDGLLACWVGQILEFLRVSTIGSQHNAKRTRLSKTRSEMRFLPSVYDALVAVQNDVETSRKVFRKTNVLLDVLEQRTLDAREARTCRNLLFNYGATFQHNLLDWRSKLTEEALAELNLVERNLATK